METLTFYRKLANTNHELMKKYKVAVVNKMKYDEIINLYKTNNLNFDEDVQRLKNFYNKNTEVTQKEKPEEKAKTTGQKTALSLTVSRCSAKSISYQADSGKSALAWCPRFRGPFHALPLS